MKSAGFAGVSCNVRDFAPVEWEKIILPRARQNSMACWPWGRTAKNGEREYDPSVVDLILSTADKWGQPAILNCETEINGTGDVATKDMAQRVGTRSAALCVLPTPFHSVDWSPVKHLPIIIQISPYENDESTRIEDCIYLWRARGFTCVILMFSSAFGQKPIQYNKQAPYHIYTGDDCGQNYKAWSPTSSGFVVCKTAPIPQEKPMLTSEQVPYTGIYCVEGKGDANAKHKGPTAEALARALSRLGYIPWGDFDQPFGPIKEKALIEFQADVGIQPTGIYGTKTWEAMRKAVVPMGKTHAGEYALDLYARKLIQDEAGVTSDSAKMTKFQTFFAEFCNLAIKNEPNWHYTQKRPGKLNINPSAEYIESDCSLFGIQAADYARRKADLVDEIRDPSKQNWTGYGNTDLYEDDWPRVGAPFRIGDAAHFHSSRHVIWCIKPGTFATAEWASHGAERTPERVILTSYYRFPEEYMFTVRPDYLKEN